MHLYKRGEVWWYDFAVNGDRHRKSTGLRSKKAAEKVADRAKEAATLGSPAVVPTIEAAAFKWFDAKQAHKRSAKTTAGRLEMMLALIGPDTPVDQIDAPEIEDAMSRRKLIPVRTSVQHKDPSKRSPKAPSDTTINRDMIDTTLRPILRFAKQVLKAPVQDIPWQDLRREEPPERDRPFTAAEITAWRAALPEWHRELFDFAARYGVRMKEAFFAPDAVDIADGRVIVRARKNGRQHTLRLLPEDAALIAENRRAAMCAGLDTVWFSVTPSGLQPIHWRGFQSASRKALDRAGIKNARPVHDLRHHAALTLLRRTGELASVKKLLGHEQIASTMRYAHADDDDVLAAMRNAYGTNDTTPEEKS